MDSIFLLDPETRVREAVDGQVLRQTRRLLTCALCSALRRRVLELDEDWRRFGGAPRRPEPIELDRRSER